MKTVRVLIPFTDRVTGEIHNENDVIQLSDERIAEIRIVNTNMVLVMGESAKTAKEEAAEPVKRPRKKKEE